MEEGRRNEGGMKEEGRSGGRKEEGREERGREGKEGRKEEGKEGRKEGRKEGGGRRKEGRKEGRKKEGEVVGDCKLPYTLVCSGFCAVPVSPVVLRKLTGGLCKIWVLQFRFERKMVRDGGMFYVFSTHYTTTSNTYNPPSICQISKIMYFCDTWKKS
jgi:hypothetical protein